MRGLVPAHRNTRRCVVEHWAIWRPHLVVAGYPATGNKRWRCKLTYNGDVDVVVPTEAGEQFRQRLRKVFAAFVAQLPDEFLLLFVQVVHWIAVNHLPQHSQVVLRHRAWIQLKTDIHFTVVVSQPFHIAVQPFAEFCLLAKPHPAKKGFVPFKTDIFLYLDMHERNIDWYRCVCVYVTLWLNLNQK